MTTPTEDDKPQSIIDVIEIIEGGDWFVPCDCSECRYQLGCGIDTGKSIEALLTAITPTKEAT